MTDDRLEEIRARRMDTEGEHETPCSEEYLDDTGFLLAKVERLRPLVAQAERTARDWQMEANRQRRLIEALGAENRRIQAEWQTAQGEVFQERVENARLREQLDAAVVVAEAQSVQLIQAQAENARLREQLELLREQCNHCRPDPYPKGFRYATGGNVEPSGPTPSGDPAALKAENARLREQLDTRIDDAREWECLCRDLEAKVERLQNKLNTDSQNFQLECQKAENARQREQNACMKAHRHCPRCGSGIILPTCDRCGESWFNDESAKMLDTRDAVPPTWNQLIDPRLTELLALPENWDSYGAHPIRPEAIKGVRWLLKRVIVPGIPVPQVVPTPAGGVQLEWNANGMHLEIEVQDRARYNAFLEDERGQTLTDLASILVRFSSPMGLTTEGSKDPSGPAPSGAIACESCGAIDRPLIARDEYDNRFCRECADGLPRVAETGEEIQGNIPDSADRPGICTYNRVMDSKSHPVVGRRWSEMGDETRFLICIASSDPSIWVGLEEVDGKFILHGEEHLNEAALALFQKLQSLMASMNPPPGNVSEVE